MPKKKSQQKKKSQHWNPPETAPANAALLGMFTIKVIGLKFITAVYIKDGVLVWFGSQKPVDTTTYEFSGWMPQIYALLILGGYQ